jgi:ubiquinone/menaquinone biosynthesis C-methylase UbiE
MSHWHPHAHDTAPHTTGNVLHWAPWYDFLTDRFLRSSEASIRALAMVRAGDKVLDVGCGPGRLTLVAQAWATPGGEAHGIDPSPEMIATARRNAAKRGLPAQFQLGVAESLPFPDAMFDVVLNRLMLHHLPGDLKARGLAEMHRVLKPGGLCLVVDFEPPKKGFSLHVAAHLFTPMAGVDVRTYVPLLEAAGFVQVETGPTNFRLLSYVRGRKKEAEGGQGARKTGSGCHPMAPSSRSG